MYTLFPIEPEFPEGFSYIPDFISEAEEAELCRLIAHIPLHPMQFQGYEARRKVESFGFDYHFDTRRLTKAKPIPREFQLLIRKVATHLSLPETDLEKLLITEYPPGSVINWHRDAPPYELIAGVSFLSDCVFRLRPHDKAKQGRGSVISFPLQRRSLYVMKGASR